MVDYQGSARVVDVEHRADQHSGVPAVTTKSTSQRITSGGPADGSPAANAATRAMSPARQSGSTALPHRPTPMPMPIRRRWCRHQRWTWADQAATTARQPAASTRACDAADLQLTPWVDRRHRKCLPASELVPHSLRSVARSDTQSGPVIATDPLSRYGSASPPRAESRHPRRERGPTTRPSGAHCPRSCRRERQVG